MKSLLLLISSLTLVCASVYSQTTCNCYIAGADTTYPRVPLTEGTDVGIPPYYHCNNCSSQAIILPFNFCFYGKDYDTVFVNNKGNLTFNHPYFNFSSKGFPFGNDTLMLAPYYADVDDTTPGFFLPTWANITYTLTSTHMIVQWSGVGYNIPDCDFSDNFQLTITNGADSILPPGNNVSYCYYLMQWATGDSGSNGFSGTPGKIGVNKGDHVNYAQFGAFDNHGYTYYGPNDTTNELYWLNNKSFIFSTCVSGNEIPPVIISSDTCLLDTICLNDTLSLGTNFLCSQIGQKATLSVSSPGITSFITDTSSSNSIFHITTRLVPIMADTGTHIITVTATDNNAPPLTNHVEYKVTINACGDTNKEAGIHAISNQNNFTVFPNPSDGVFTIQSPVVSGRWSLEVFNALGEQVYSATLPQISKGTLNTINLTKQPDGVYFYRVLNEEGSLEGEGKLIIQK